MLDRCILFLAPAACLLNLLEGNEKEPRVESLSASACSASSNEARYSAGSSSSGVHDKTSPQKRIWASDVSGIAPVFEDEDEGEEAGAEPVPVAAAAAAALSSRRLCALIRCR